MGQPEAPARATVEPNTLGGGRACQDAKRGTAACRNASHCSDTRCVEVRRNIAKCMRAAITLTAALWPRPNLRLLSSQNALPTTAPAREHSTIPSRFLSFPRARFGLVSFSTTSNLSAGCPINEVLPVPTFLRPREGDRERPGGT